MKKRQKTIKRDKSAKIEISGGETGACWYYSDLVKDHFFRPRNFLKRDPRPGEFDAEGQVGNFKCGDIMRMWIKVDPKTKKIKNLKWRTFGAVVKGEFVLLSNYQTEPIENVMPETKIIDGDGKINRVAEVVESTMEGNIITLELATSNYYNISLTPNHPVPCVLRNEVSKPIRKSGKRWSEVKDSLLQKSVIKIRPISELKEGDFLIFKVDKNIKDNKELNKEICVLLGYYVSDGNIKSVNRIIFNFNITEEKYIKKIENIAKKLNLDYKIFKRKTENVLCVQIYNKKLVSLLLKHGGRSGNKYFSNEVMRLPLQKQMLILDSYLEGDGWSSQQKNNWNEQYFISTSQENLAFQLQTILARNGIFAPIHKRKPRLFVIKEKEYMDSGEINLVFKKNKHYSWIKYHKKYKCFLIPIRKIVSHEYSGYIYDIALQGSPHTYKIKGITVHNCAPAIASTSMFSEMVLGKGGMTIEKALKITPQDIIKRLGGVPSRKIHCSIMAHQAFSKAIENYNKSRALPRSIKNTAKPKRVKRKNNKQRNTS
jgi:NifU-like protein involved in Fe-S cluster formation